MVFFRTGTNNLKLIIMKKSILLTVIIAGFMSVSPLKAQFSIGPGVVYGTEIEQVGLSANASFDFLKRLGVMGDYTYFFKKNSLEWWTLDFDATLDVLRFSETSKLYGLAGVNWTYYSFPEGTYSTGSGSKTYTGFNLGAGWKIGVANKMSVVPEVRYTFASLESSSGYLRFGVKLMFGL
jgi:opacity protein-like surface antigen